MKHAIWMCLLGALGLWAQNSVIVKAVEPEWSFGANEAVISAPLSVEMIVLPDGTPYDVDAEAQMPMALVRALIQYQMAPNASPYKTRFTVQVKIPVEKYRGSGGWNAKAVRPIPDPLDAAKVAQLEASLKEDESSVDIRSALVLWAYGKPEARETRARQVAWLVEHAPEAEVLRHPAAWIDGGSGADSDPQGYVRIRSLWVSFFSTRAVNAKTIGAAAMFLRLRDPRTAENLLKAGANVTFYATPALGELYAFAALGIQRLNPRTGAPIAPSPDAPVSEFGVQARGVLAASTDLRLLYGARSALARVRGATRDEIPGFEALCSDVLRQLKSVQGSALLGCGAAPPPELPKPDRRVITGVQAAAIVKQPRPAYPDDARRRRIQGKVMFSAIIDKDGKVKEVSYVSGPLPLVLAAHDAVIRWEYKPTILNGEPVEVATDIEVNFTLN